MKTTGKIFIAVAVCGCLNIACYAAEPDKLNKADEIYTDGQAAGSGGIAVPCNFKTQIDDQAILDFKQGTIEFRLKLNAASRVPESEWKGQSRRMFFYCGPLRPDHPRMNNFNCLSIFQEKQWGNLVFSIANNDYKCRQVSVGSAENWKAGEWHHVAAVWNLDVNGKTMMKIFIDGRLSSAEVIEWDKPNDAALPVTPVDFDAQLGAMNSGEYPADAVFDDLRISTQPLYNADFKPEPGKTMNTDGVAFDFNNSLDGKYRLKGKTGIIQAQTGILMKK